VSVTGVNFASAISRSIDQVLIGWMWGAGALGLYERAAKLLLTPLQNIYAPLYAVAVPALSRIDQREERYRRVFCDILEKLAMLVVPGALLVGVCADWVVRVLLGPQWLGAAPLVACFALAAACQPLSQAVVLLYLTQNRSREMLRAAAIDVVLCVVAVLCGLPFGANYVAASLALFGVVLRAPMAFFLASRRGPVRFADIIKAVIPSILAGMAGAVAAGAMRATILARETPATDALAVVALVAWPVILMIFGVLPRSRRTLQGLRGMARHLRGPRPNLAE
jgi:PST family polysaccharide transporter